MKKTDITIMAHLRKNGRMPLTELSRQTKLPVSTIHERLKQHMRKGVYRPSTLINFEKIGYATRAHILLSVEQPEKGKLFEHLKAHPNVNSLSRINNGWNIIMECVFKDMISLEEFVEKLENAFHIKQKQVHYVLNEFKREGFLAQPESAEALF